MKHSLVIAFCWVLGLANAQKATDQLFRKDGTTVAVKVLEISGTDIKYKKATNLDGPTYTVTKSEVTKIIYANGETETFAIEPDPKKRAETKTETPFGVDNFLTFSNDGRHIITDLTLDDKKPYLCTWNYNSQLQSKILFDNQRINEPMFNWQMVADDGSYVSSARLYDKDQKLLVTFVNPETNNAFGADFTANIISPNGKRVLIKTGDGTDILYTFDNSGKLLKTTKIKGKMGANALRFSHGSTLYLFSRPNGMKGGVVEIFDADGNPVSTITLVEGWTDKFHYYNKAGGYNVKSFINFSFDDQLIIIPNSQEEVGIWDIKGNLVKSLPHFMAKVAAISRDGKMVATAGSLPYGKEVKSKGQVLSGGQLKIWSIDGTLVKEISFPVDPSSVEFTPDNAAVVAVVEGGVVWLSSSTNYSLPSGLDNILIDVAKSLEEGRQAEKKADRDAKWRAVGEGFVEGMAKMNKEMAAERIKVAQQEKFINTTVNNALTDCRFAVFTRTTKDGWFEVSDIYKITRGCELTIPGGVKVYYGETYEAAAKLIDAVAEKEAKDNGTVRQKFEEWNKGFGKGAKAGEGGCLCK